MYRMINTMLEFKIYIAFKFIELRIIIWAG